MTRNAILLVAGRVASALTTLGVLSVVGRALGAESLGLLSVGFALGQIGAVLTELGLTGFVVREGARSRDGLTGAFRHALGLRVVTTPIVATVGLLILARSGAEGIVIWLAAMSLVLQSLADLTRSVSLATRRGDVWAAHAIVENVTWLAAVASLLAFGFPLAVALAAGCLVMLSSFAVGLVVISRLYGVHPRPEPGGRDGLRAIAPFAAYSLLGTAYLRGDTLLVAALVPGSGLVAAGAYYAAVRLLAAFEYIPEAMSLALLPELAEGFARDPNVVSPQLRPAARLLVLVSIPVPFLMLLVSGDLLQFLFGDELVGYGWVLVLLSVLVPIRCYQWLAGAGLTGTDRQAVRAAAVGAGLLALVATDVLLIPRIGILGAVAGSAIGLATVVVIYAPRIPAIGAAFLDAGTALWSLLAASLAFGLGLLGVQVALVVGAAVFGLAYLIAVFPRLSRLGHAQSAAARPRPPGVQPGGEREGL